MESPEFLLVADWIVVPKSVDADARRSRDIVAAEVDAHGAPLLDLLRALPLHVRPDEGLAPPQHKTDPELYKIYLLLLTEADVGSVRATTSVAEPH